MKKLEDELIGEIILDPSHKEFDLPSVILLADIRPERFSAVDLKTVKHWKTVTKNRKSPNLSVREIRFLAFIKKYVEMEENE